MKNCNLLPFLGNPSVCVSVSLANHELTEDGVIRVHGFNKVSGERVKGFHNNFLLIALGISTCKM